MPRNFTDEVIDHILDHAIICMDLIDEGRRKHPEDTDALTVFMSMQLGVAMLVGTLQRCDEELAASKLVADGRALLLARHMVTEDLS